MSNNIPAVQENDPALPVLLEFQSPTTGVLATPIPPIARRLTLTIGTMFAALMIAAGVIPVDQVVTAQGEVVSKSPTLVVQPYDLSIVKSIDVHVGEHVHAGEVLAQLNPTIATADLNSELAQVSALQAQVSRLQAEATGGGFTYTGAEPDLTLQAAIFAQKKAEYDYKLRNYQEKINSLIDQINAANANAKGYAERLKVAQEVEQMRRASEKAYVGSKLNTLAAMDNTAEMARNLASEQQAARQSAQDLAAQVAERDGYVESWHADISQQLADATQKLSDARADLHKAQLHHQMVELRADRDATVLTVARISVGSVVQPGQQIVTLMPADAPLEVEANIAGSDNGYVKVGDPVGIKFDTFPFTRYGMAHGTLRIISANSFTALDQQQNPGNVPLPPNSTEPYYKGRITLDKVNLHGVPEGFHLIPGMPVTADIKIGKHTILSYMLERVLPITQDAMREP